MTTERMRLPRWKSVAGWAWAVLATLLAFGGLSDGYYIMVVLMIVSAAIAVPALRPTWMRFIPSRAIGWTSTAFGIAGLVALGMSAPPPADRPKPIAVSVAQPKAPKRNPVAKATPAAAVPAVDVKGDFRTMYRSVIATTKNCDARAEDASKALVNIGRGTETMAGAYGAAKEAQAECQAAMLQFDKISIPASLDANDKEKAQKGIDLCQVAYSRKSSAMEGLMAVIDGDARPSKQNAVTEDFKTAQGATLLCLAELIGIGSKLDVDMQNL